MWKLIVFNWNLIRNHVEYLQKYLLVLAFVAAVCADVSHLKQDSTAEHHHSAEYDHENENEQDQETIEAAKPELPSPAPITQKPASIELGSVSTTAAPATDAKPTLPSAYPTFPGFPSSFSFDVSAYLSFDCIF